MAASAWNPLKKGWKSVIQIQKQHCHTNINQHASPAKRPIRYYGQPAPSTHPHLLQEGQVTPGLSVQEFQRRRHRLMEAIAKYTSTFPHGIQHHLVVIPSASKLYMSEKIPYVFHQNTDFQYTSGFQEPNSVLVLHTTVGKSLPHHKTTMFVPKHDSHTELWDGPRTGVDGAVDLLGVNEALNVNELEPFLNSFVKDKRNFAIWYDYTTPCNLGVHTTMKNLVTSSRQMFVESPRKLIQELRVTKSDEEITLMKKTCEIASSAFVDVMLFSHPGVSEHLLNAKMDFECRIRGANYLAYPPVVAGGNRANIIHYINNNQCIDDGEMVLMDAGCYYHGYASDITRTWPVGGKYSQAQRTLYEILLEVQLNLIQLCNKRASLDTLFTTSCKLLGKKLQQLGIIPSSYSTQQLIQAAQGFCPHHVGHYLGMDVHDTSLIARNLPLQPGMIITVEPGIYISENNIDVPDVFRGIGIRIEDNVLITETGCSVLTASCPKELADIEAILAARGPQTLLHVD